MTIPLERCLCCWSTTNWVLQQQMASQQQSQRPQEEHIMQLQTQIQSHLQAPLTRQSQLTHQQVAHSPSHASDHSAQSNIVAPSTATTTTTATSIITNTDFSATDISAMSNIGISRRDKKKKSKRVRTTFTPEQLSRLEAEFVSQNYLVGEYRNYLARLLNLNECQVKVWFQNRRIKKRKQEKQERKEHQ